MAGFQLGVSIKGVRPGQVYQHLADPNSLLGLQPLLVAVEGVRRGTAAEAGVVAAQGVQQGGAAEAAAVRVPAAPAAPEGSDVEDELWYEAVEEVPLCSGALSWRNRIRVRQQLLGSGWAAGGPPARAEAAAAAAEAATIAAAEVGQQTLGMRYLVTSPPAGLVRLEVRWTFSPAEERAAEGAAGGAATGSDAAAAEGGAAAAAVEGGSGSTQVQLDASIQAPWLLR